MSQPALRVLYLCSHLSPPPPIGLYAQMIGKRNRSKPREQLTYSRNPPATEKTKEKKQNVFVFPLCCAWAASLAFGGWLGCLVGCLACLWRLARLPLAQIRSTEKMAEGIKPDNVICLVTPGSARQDFLNQSFLKWRATSNNLLCKQSFS